MKLKYSTILSALILCSASSWGCDYSNTKHSADASGSGKQSNMAKAEITPAAETQDVETVAQQNEIERSTESKSKLETKK